ncbi:MAG: DUF433 domain-containing protein [Acidobacteria bacterium]|nr:DUF433 domain-containing protein [Acidobacteriota bacterium]
MQEFGGAYVADRAAALSGVPKSTIYYWARKGHLEPSVSRTPLRWSFTDLLALRTLYWLRQTKKAFDQEVPSTSWPKIRRAIEQLKDLDLGLFHDSRCVVGVTLSGEITLDARNIPPQRVNGQLIQPDIIDILAPFSGLERTMGPDLRMPRATLRIIPRKISGAPHIADTRLPTQTVHALALRGYSMDELAELYPFASLDALSDSLDLERQLQRNAQVKAA